MAAQVDGTACEEDRRVIETGRAFPFFDERTQIDGESKSMLIDKISVAMPDGDRGVCMIGLDISDPVAAMDALESVTEGSRRTLELLPKPVMVAVSGDIVFAKGTNGNWNG
ncbi:MAG: hypothetical protein VW226_13080 [Rhodospirillaceae bacterium]|jgi:hypothetical protein